VDPRALVPDVDHLKKVRVESGLSTTLPKQGFMRPGATGRNHHTVELLLFDGIFDLVDA
jgi:hypothetical protein